MTRLPPGSKVWAIGDGCISGPSVSNDHALTPYDAACIPNPGDARANVAFVQSTEPIVVQHASVEFSTPESRVVLGAFATWLRSEVTTDHRT
jgi:hypothetical protein